MGRIEGAVGLQACVESKIMRLLQKVWPWNPRVSWFSRMSDCRAGLSMKVDREIQNICGNPLEPCPDYKSKSLFADVLGGALERDIFLADVGRGDEAIFQPCGILPHSCIMIS